MAKRVSFSVCIFFLSFSLLFSQAFLVFPNVFPAAWAEIEMTLSVIWFGQRFHWQLARAATGHTTCDTALGKGKAMGQQQQQVFGVALAPALPRSPLPEVVCDL